MRFLALATDYDGTIATGGQVGESTFAALDRFRQTGRKVLLVTGREIPDLMHVCQRLDAFDCIVAENGALLYDPATRRETSLAAPPPVEFVQTLKARNVAPMSVGRVIVATWQPHETAVLETIRDRGLELQVIFNKGAVMILPSGVNKATGLAAALDALCLSPHNVLAVGDAENDHALCKSCEASAAVANALPTLKEAVDLVLENHHGAGVEELIARVINDDLQSIESRLARHHLLLGHSSDGSEVRLPPYGVSLLITGPRGGGKSSLAASFIERLAQSKYQFCLVDPDGSYAELAHATAIGQGQDSLDLQAVAQLLHKPHQNAHVSLAGVAAAHRRQSFSALASELQKLRIKTGRPHWLLIDDAEMLIPAAGPQEELTLGPSFDRVALITETPRQVSAAVLQRISALAVVGDRPRATVAAFCTAIGRTLPEVSDEPLPIGTCLFWRLDNAMGPIRMRVAAVEQAVVSAAGIGGENTPRIPKTMTLAR
jgi:hydroxymethylpyrimidine pyrophosphatase-like HAD family hydrolase